jgi:hypothetical protein
MTASARSAYFVPDGDALVPTALARGPWGQSISGNFIGGVLAHAIERDEGDPELLPARLTVDLLRPAALEPLVIRCRVLRQGRRLKLVDAEVSQSGVVVAKAGALLLRTGDQPPGRVWTAPDTMPPAPDADDESAEPMMLWAFGRESATAGCSMDLSPWQHDGPKFVWLRDRVPRVEGIPITPFTRAAMAGDVASSLTHFGTDGLQYINADYTLTLSRLPEGPDVGLAALTFSGHDGVATGTAALFDRRGQIGSATATTLANPGFRPPAD